MDSSIKKIEKKQVIRFKKRIIKRVPRADVRADAAEEEAAMQEEDDNASLALRRDSLHPEDDETQLNKRGDKRGMHLKDNPRGSEFYKKIRAMRKIYNKQMPVLACNACSFSASCPKYRAGYECFYVPFLRSHNVTDERSLLDEMKNLVSSNMSRLHLAKTFETLGGGSPSLEVTEASSLIFNQMKDLYELMTDIEEEEAEFEENSIIGQLFGNIDLLAAHTEQSLQEIKMLSEKDKADRAKKQRATLIETEVDVLDQHSLLGNLSAEAQMARFER